MSIRFITPTSLSRFTYRYANISPKMVNPRDKAGNAEENEGSISDQPTNHAIFNKSVKF